VTKPSKSPRGDRTGSSTFRFAYYAAADVAQRQFELKRIMQCSLSLLPKNEQRSPLFRCAQSDWTFPPPIAQLVQDTFEKHWSKSVPDSIIKSTDSREKKRQEVINELIYTEQHHVRDLQIIEKVQACLFKSDNKMKKCGPVNGFATPNPRKF